MMVGNLVIETKKFHIEPSNYKDVIKLLKGHKDDWNSISNISINSNGVTVVRYYYD